MKDLAGRVALVTGASRGLGKAIAVALATRGAKVAVNYFGSPELAAGVVSAIESAGGVARPFRANVTDETEVKTMVADVEQAFGPSIFSSATPPAPSRSFPSKNSPGAPCSINSNSS